MLEKHIVDKKEALKKLINSFDLRLTKELPKTTNLLVKLIGNDDFWQIRHPLQNNSDKNNLRKKSYIYGQYMSYSDFNGLAFFRTWYSIQLLEALISKIDLIQSPYAPQMPKFKNINYLKIAQDLDNNGHILFNLSDETYSLALKFRDASDLLLNLEKSLSQQKPLIDKLQMAGDVGENKNWKYSFLSHLGNIWNELTCEFNFELLQSHLDFDQKWQNKFASKEVSFRAFIALILEVIDEIGKNETLKELNLEIMIKDYIENLASHTLSNLHKVRVFTA